MIAIALMAFTASAAWNGILYGVPPALLLVALGRCRRKAPKAAWVYLLFLAGWLAHLAVLPWSQTRLPAAVRIEPADALPFAAPQIAQLDGRSVLQVQAPTRLDWTLRGDERRLRFTYGFIPAAYEQGTTNGAGLTVTLRHAGIVRTIFHRELAPRDRTEDRGPQPASLVLPPVTPGEQLSLTIDAGPNGDDAWDWVHLSNFGFQRSAALWPEQFPSFQRVPDSVAAPLSVVFQQHEHPFFLHLHAPAQIDYVLHGTEKKVRFSYGFLPGAYQNGNATDGARFLVLLQSAAGGARTLLDRGLDPLARREDRGPQPAEISLGAGQAGDRLVFRIEPGPAGSNSWDWTYLSRLSFE